MSLSRSMCSASAINSSASRRAVSLLFSRWRAASPSARATCFTLYPPRHLRGRGTAEGGGGVLSCARRTPPSASLTPPREIAGRMIVALSRLFQPRQPPCLIRGDQGIGELAEPGTFEDRVELVQGEVDAVVGHASLR